MNPINALCVQLTRDLFAIANFLFRQFSADRTWCMLGCCHKSWNLFLSVTQVSWAKLAVSSSHDTLL